MRYRRRRFRRRMRSRFSMRRRRFGRRSKRYMVVGQRF